MPTTLRRGRIPKEVIQNNISILVQLFFHKLSLDGAFFVGDGGLCGGGGGGDVLSSMIALLLLLLLFTSDLSTSTIVFSSSCCSFLLLKIFCILLQK